MKCNANPKVSIIIPFYNNEDYLIPCVNSVLSQQFHDFELIIINDGSTDTSPNIIKSYMNKLGDSRIHYYENNTNMGPGYSRNKGLYLARGIYICFCDSDDTLHPHFLNKLVTKIADNDFVYCAHESIDAINQRVIKYKWPFATSSKDIKTMYLKSKIHFAHTACLYNRLFLLEHNLYYNITYRHTQDIEFMCNILLTSPKCASVPENLYIYNIHPNSLSNEASADSIFDEMIMLHQVQTRITNPFLKLNFIFGRCASHAYHLSEKIYKYQLDFPCPIRIKWRLLWLTIFYLLKKPRFLKTKMCYIKKLIKL